RAGKPPGLTGVEWLLLPSLEDERLLYDAVTGCDAVVHLAALAHQSNAADRVPEFMRVNTEGTRLLGCASVRAGVARFVFMSSVAAVCPRSDTLDNDETPALPTDVYGRSKYEGERALVAVRESSATDWCLLRPPLVYGPGNPGNMRRL